MVVGVAMSVLGLLGISDVIILASITALSTAFTTVYVTRQTRKNKREEWERQDLVAKRLKEENEIKRVAAQTAEKKLNDLAAGIEQVHLLSNSHLTASKEIALSGKQYNLVLLRRLPQSEGVDAEIKTVMAEIELLTNEIIERKRQAALAEKVKEVDQEFAARSLPPLSGAVKLAPGESVQVDASFAKTNITNVTDEGDSHDS